MGNISRTIMLDDGTPIPEGSQLAVSSLDAELNRLQAELSNNVTLLLSLAPEAVQDEWRKLFYKAMKPFDELDGRVGRFSVDYRARGLDSAIQDAKSRRELP